MGLVDKLRVAMGGKAKALSNKVVQSYRDHLGDELLKKQQDVEELAAQLNSRDVEISSREANLKKYYLVPRAYINVPIGLVLLAAVYFGYKALTPENSTDSTKQSAATVDGTSMSRDAEGVPSYSACISKGIAYYKEIGSYPLLSTGEDARKKIEGMCRRSNGMAFGR